MPNSCLLAIPALNEGQTIATVLTEARRFCADVLVVDDGSTDDTPQVLSRCGDVQVLTHSENLGYGRSLADAIEYATARTYEWLIVMDGDGQHEPADIPRFLAVARQDKADVVSGTRYPAGYDAGQAAPTDRREINRRITGIINARLGLGITDAFCGFKAYRVASLARLAITEPGYAAPIQMWVQIARAGLRVRELPVRLIYNNPCRFFGGGLDDPVTRLEYYLSALTAELDRSDSRSDFPQEHGLLCT